MAVLLEPFSVPAEEQAIVRFKETHPDFFRKNDSALALHLAAVFLVLAVCITGAVLSENTLLRIFLGSISAFFWFSLINVTIHHHHTHKNAAQGPLMKKVLDLVYLLVLPNAPRRKSRYTKAHLNHHFRPFHETDVDHHYGTGRFLRMMKNPGTALWYFLELTFVGAYVPGWEDDRYMNQVPLEQWSRAGYEAMKKIEMSQNIRTSLLQWGGFLLAAAVLPALGVHHFLLTLVVWGWAFPMLMVKNWAHFLGQFQHYGEACWQEGTSIWRRTKSFHIPGWLNWLAGGELSGHFLHHIYPEMPYYHVEAARRQFAADAQVNALIIY